MIKMGSCINILVFIINYSSPRIFVFSWFKRKDSMVPSWNAISRRFTNRSKRDSSTETAASSRVDCNVVTSSNVAAQAS